jgi:hypothetical protein
VTTKSDVTIFTQSHIVSKVLPSSAMLQELSHMDKITQLQDEIQQVLFSLNAKSRSTEGTMVVFSFS